MADRSPDVQPDPIGCTSGKKTFPTEDAVRAHFRRVLRRRADPDAPPPSRGKTEKGYYECPGCRGWHLKGSTGKTRRASHDSWRRTR